MLLSVITQAQQVTVESTIRNFQRTNLQNASHHQNQQGLLYALVTVPLQLHYVPSKMDLLALATMETACQVFLDQGLDNDPFIDVWEVRTTVLSQSIAETVTQTHHNASVTTLYILSSSLEVTIGYRIDSEGSSLKDIETQILGLFSIQWDFLRQLLLVLNEPYFAHVETIQVRPNNTNQNFFDQFDNSRDNVSMKHGNGNNDWGTYGLIAVFVMAGLAILISLLFLIPLLTGKLHGQVPEAELNVSTHDRNDVGKRDAFSGSSWSRAAIKIGKLRSTSSASSKEFGVESTEEEEMERTLEKVGGTVSTKEHEGALYTTQQKIGIQPIYSDDKVQSHLMLMELRSKKYDATEKLHTTVSKYRNSSDYGDLASIADSCPDVASEDQSVRRTNIPNTPPNRIQAKRDIENQIKVLRNQKQAIENRIRDKYDKLSRIRVDSQTQTRSKDTTSGRSTRRGEYLIQYAEDLLRRNDSLSTMTRGGKDHELDEDEVEQAFDVLHNGMGKLTGQGTSINKQGFPIQSRTRAHDSRILSTHQKEYY
ncbi:hypothetical protein IV203_001920 [Nitzschia inconspicua]|uniref:Uncharacterized protein n=1 Tax=Nitzschia inconspicua TaxID=303405 RepID=A0A9K3L7U8_9STRA|nr:hypothetical protein IV203_001920 [Nitzschia inconspicua]